MANATNSIPQITNSVFSGNKATNGSAVHNNTSHPVLLHTTLAGNQGNGVLFNNTSSNPQIKNSIIYGNSSGIVNNSSTPVITNSLVQGYTYSTGDLNNLSNTTDPLFTNTPSFNTAPFLGGDYALKVSSPAIDKGDNSFVNTTIDLAGNQRIRNIQADLGAYEQQQLGTIVVATPDANGIVYVKPDGYGTGASWTNAYGELADALVAAKQNTAIQYIHVARGTYKPMYTPQDGQNFTPNPSNARDKAFLLVNNVKVYGGFAGTETSLSQRDLTLTANKSILSGDIGTVANTADNTYHVIVSAGEIGTAELNGFTVTAANGNDLGSSILINNKQAPRNYGGGMLNTSSSPSINKVIFAANNSGGGGGMNNTGTSLPTISQTVFMENTATNGGGMENSGQSSPTITNTLFSGNTANRGGGINNAISLLTTITNTVFSGNNAAQDGGAIYNLMSPLIVTNSTLSGNKASGSGGGIYNDDDFINYTFQIRNSIVLGNSTGIYQEIPNSNQEISNSLIQGETSNANGNLDATGVTPTQIFNNAPNFTTAPFTAGDYTLVENSLAINKGDQTLFDTGKTPDLSGITTDLAGNPRIFDNEIDMGAFENQTETVLPVTLTSFTVSKQVNKALIQWQTAIETRNKEFVVSRSADGLNFTALNTIVAKGNNSSYNYSDFNPFNGANYYRLQQQDLDGKIATFGIKVLRFDLSASNVSVYPNPTQEQLTVAYAPGIYQTLTITDFLGSVLLVKKLGANSTNQVVSLTAFNAGTYFVKLAGKAKAEVLKVIKN
uniref:choice-of-anchor Q domain-containing protein n=1 Tax=Pedobacter arcticus TaxID=752140 RepID=UPI00373FD641